MGADGHGNKKRGQVKLVAIKFEALILLSGGTISEIDTDRPGLCIPPIYMHRHGRTRKPWRQTSLHTAR